MKITSFNIQNIKLNKSSFVHQNPINFKGEQKEDSFEYTQDNTSFIEEYKAKTEQEIEELNQEYGKIYKQINIAQTLQEEINLTSDEFNILKGIVYSRGKNRKELEPEVKKIIEKYLKEIELDNETLEFFSSIFKRVIYASIHDYQANDNLKQEFEHLIFSLRAKQRKINGQLNIKRNNLHSMSVGYKDIFGPFGTKSSEYRAFREIVQEELNKGHLIDLSNARYSHISTSAKDKLLRSFTRVQLGHQFFPTDEIDNVKTLASLAGQKVYSLDEIEKLYGISNPSEIFPNCKIHTLRTGSILIGFSKDDPSLQILEDISKGEVKTIYGLNKGLATKIEGNPPFVYKKYSSSDEPTLLDFTFIKLDDENNKKLLGSSQFRRIAQTLPFKYNKLGFADISDKYNADLLKNTQYLFPEKSKYAFESLGSPKPIKINIPVEELEKLGFSKANLLIDLINNGKLDGKQSEDGQYIVTIDTKYRLGKNKNLDVLYMLRKQDPRIKTFKEVAQGLKITQKRLEFAIFSGDFEIIREYINVADRESRYINIATPKNQEFIRKVKFEQEFERQLKETQREERKKARIEQKDLTSRLQSVRMALVWYFMPNTKAVGSMLAKKDGYIAKLLAKEDDPNEILTNFEEAKINSYRKEMWTIAGTDELHEAYKKEKVIMKTFKEKGLDAIDEEYLPIFERYGFTK